MICDIVKPGTAMGLLMGLAGCLGVMTCVSALGAEQPGVEGTQPSGFKYSDDWSIVSAPPPPGPYYSVDVDPRVPGQEDNTPSSVTGYEPSAEIQDQMINTFRSEPPSAGRTASQSAPSGRYSAPPYGYRSNPYERPYGYQHYGTPQIRNYPREYYGPSGSYYYPPDRPAVSVNPGSEEEVPPPPVYDRMMRTTPPGQYGYRRGGY